MDFCEKEKYSPNYYQNIDFEDMDFEDMDFLNMNFNYIPMYYYYLINTFYTYYFFNNMQKMYGMMRSPKGNFNMPSFPGMPFFPNNNNAQKPPKSGPPNFTPNKSKVKSQKIDTKAIDKGSIRPCIYRYTYIWQTNGNSYWTYLTYVGRKSIGGWRWMRFRWVYFGLDLNKIDSFYCI